MENKHTVDDHPSPSQLISRIHTLYFCGLWRNFFLKLYIPPCLQKSVKFIVLRLLQIHLWVKKLNLFIFTHAPRQNSLPGFYNYPPVRWKLSIPPEQRFLKIFFPEEKGGRRLWSWKRILKLTKISVTSFDKFHHLCNLYIFGLCFVFHQVAMHLFNSLVKSCTLFWKYS